MKIDLPSLFWARFVVKYGERVARCFAAKVEIADSGCWLWKGARSGSTKRPSFWLQGRQVYAARLALYLRLGRAIRPEKVAAHTCDNPICVNPEHIEEASYSSNLSDAWARGRRRVRMTDPVTFIEDAA